MDEEGEEDEEEGGREFRGRDPRDKLTTKVQATPLLTPILCKGRHVSLISNENAYQHKPVIESGQRGLYLHIWS